MYMSLNNGHAAQELLAAYNANTLFSKKLGGAIATDDAYAVQFTGPEGLEDVTLAIRDGDGWAALAGEDCVVEGPFSEGYITAPPARDAACDAVPLVGRDSAFGARFWVVLDSDAELALIETP